MSLYYPNGVPSLDVLPDEAAKAAASMAGSHPQFPAIEGTPEKYVLSWTSPFYVDICFENGQMVDWTGHHDGKGSKGWDGESLQKYLERTHG